MSIKFKDRFGKNHNVSLSVERYAARSGGLAIVMDSDDGQFDMLTVFLEDFPTCGNKAFVDTNNLGDNIINWIEENNLGVQTSRLGFSGFCIYPEVDFNLDEINKHLTKEK